MAPDVEKELTKGYQCVREVGEQEAEKWLERLEANGNYVKDVWSGI